MFIVAISQRAGLTSDSSQIGCGGLVKLATLGKFIIISNIRIMLIVSNVNEGEEISYLWKKLDR